MKDTCLKVLRLFGIELLALAVLALVVAGAAQASGVTSLSAFSASMLTLGLWFAVAFLALVGVVLMTALSWALNFVARRLVEGIAVRIGDLRLLRSLKRERDRRESLRAQHGVFSVSSWLYRVFRTQKNDEFILRIVREENGAVICTLKNAQEGAASFVTLRVTDSEIYLADPERRFGPALPEQPLPAAA